MFEQQSGGGFPTIDVSLQLDASLGHTLGPGGPLHRSVLENVQQKLRDVVGLLGIPGTVVLDIGPLQATERADSQWMSLRVNGELCRYPEEVLVFAWSFATERTADTKPAEVRSRLQDAAGAETENGARQVAEFFGLACAEIISQQPAVLLGPAQLAAYAAQLEGSAPDRQPNPSPPGTSRLLPVLKRVLDLRISIADTEQVARVLVDSGAAPWEHVAENLIDALAPDVAELHLPEAYVARLTTPDEKGSDQLAFTREALFVKLGVVFPSCHPVPTTALKPNSFKFLINHLPTLPIVGLEADECLVNDTPERLKLMTIEGRAAVNPATQQPAAVVDGEKKEQLEAAGLTTWDQAGYCLLCLAEALRRNCGCFIRRRLIQIQLEQLSGAFPALVKVVREKVSLEKITHVLRALGSEDVSIGNLRLILERLLDYQYQTADLERYLILDDRLSISGYLQEGHTDDLVSFVRSGLKRQISDQYARDKYARGTSTLVVYLLAPEVENLFNSSNTDSVPDEDRQASIITALANELTRLPPTAQAPPILTAIGVRAGLRDAIKVRFPRVSVLAYQELRPDLNIQPVARISLH